MKQLRILFFLLVSGSSLPAQKPITLEDCFVFFKFYPLYGEQFAYLKDGTHYADLDKKEMHIRDFRYEQSDSVVTLQLPDSLVSYDDFVMSPMEDKLLLRTAPEPLYRHSVIASYYVYDLKTKHTVPVNPGMKQQYAAFAPDGKSVVFVAGNNLYINNLDKNKISQITSDGEKNKIINGVPDWVYEEEFSPVDGKGMVAVRWSPDSRYLAFIRFDESKVPEYSLTWYEGATYPKITKFKYPKVGEPNSKVSVHLYDTQSGSMAGEVMGLEGDDYVPRIHFTPDNQLVVSRLNRRQDTLDLLVALPDRVIQDQESHENFIPVKLLWEETDPAYVEIEWENKLVFLKNDPQHFLLVSERSGFEHIWRMPMSAASGEAPVELTPGKFDLTAFYGINEKTGKFYYQTATPTPLDRQIWEGSLNGAPARLITPPSGTHEASFSPDFQYMEHTWSDANTPPVVSICDLNDDTIRVIARNERVRRLRQEYGFVPKEFFSFKIADGTELNGWMIKPARMEPGKKYPVLFDNYGGPGSQTVQNQYDGYMMSWHQLLAQKGYIIVSVDNRGTGARGRDFKKCTQLQLGKLETEDQIAAARYLATLPWVDPARIGIWGWSFGGYLSTSCILKGADVFKMAMAVAPVTNWKWYDSAYTERYMHTMKDNERGYEENSPINFADKLRGDNYLICHGIADDNVHWQQTTEMINALIKANKQFETYYYPNRNHGIYGDNATIHLFTKLTNFIMEKL